MQLHEKLKEARDLAGVTLKVASEAIGISISQMQYIESGVRQLKSLNQLAKLATLYDVPPQYFLDESTVDIQDLKTNDEIARFLKEYKDKKRYIAAINPVLDKGVPIEVFEEWVQFLLKNTHQGTQE